MIMSLIVDLHGLRWLPLDLLIQHHALNIMYRYYTAGHSIFLDPPIIFGHQHSYSTRSTPLLLLSCGVICLLQRKFFFVHQPHPGGTSCQTLYLTFHCLPVYIF